MRSLSSEMLIESFLCACSGGLGRGRRWGLDAFSPLLKLNTSWRWTIVFTPRPFYPPTKEPPVLMRQEVAWPTADLIALETRTLDSAGRRTKILLTCNHHSLPAPCREYLVRFPSVLSLKLRPLQEFLLHLLGMLSFSSNSPAEQILPAATQQNSDSKLNTNRTLSSPSQWAVVCEKYLRSGVILHLICVCKVCSDVYSPDRCRC